MACSAELSRTADCENRIKIELCTSGSKTDSDGKRNRAQSNTLAGTSGTGTRSTSATTRKTPACVAQ